MSYEIYRAILAEGEKLKEENERLRNRIAKLQSLGVVDIDALDAHHKRLIGNLHEVTNERDSLRTQIEELTKHNHALAERAKRAEASCRLPTSVYKDASTLIEWVEASRKLACFLAADSLEDFNEMTGAVERVAKHIYEGRS